MADLARVGGRRDRRPVASGCRATVAAAGRTRCGGPAMNAPYGFDEDAATRRLLRSRPPMAALAWVESVVGGSVEAVRALRGGLSSAVHLVTVAGERMVLRRYVRPETPVDDPGIADHEARALDFVDQVPIPTPRLLATDLAGVETGVPTILMSWLPGRVEWEPSNVDGWLRGMANLLPTIHNTTLPAPGV